MDTKLLSYILMIVGTVISLLSIVALAKGHLFLTVSLCFGAIVLLGGIILKGTIDA